MGHEELKLILDTIGGMADGASTAAIWWLALHYITKLLTVLATVGVVGFCVVTIARTISGTVAWAEAGRRVAVAWGASYGNWCVYGSDEDRAISRAIAAVPRKD